MCMALFIGSDNELPLIAWQEGALIYVEAMSTSGEANKFAAGYLKKPHKYYIGAWEGCSCGFSFDFFPYEHYDELDEKMNIMGKQSVEALFEFIKTNVSGSECELLSLAEDEQYQGIPNKVTINLNDFALGDYFEFSEGQYTVVKK